MKKFLTRLIFGCPHCGKRIGKHTYKEDPFTPSADELHDDTQWLQRQIDKYSYVFIPGEEILIEGTITLNKDDCVNVGTGNTVTFV